MGALLLQEPCVYKIAKPWPLCASTFTSKGEAGVGQAAGVREKATAIPAKAHSKARKLLEQAALVSQARCSVIE